MPGMAFAPLTTEFIPWGSAAGKLIVAIGSKLAETKAYISFAKKLTNFFDRVMDLMTTVAGILLICALLMVSGAIASRYFLGRPIGWVVEITEYIILYIAFLVAAWVLKKEEHVKMDMVLNRLNPGAQSLLNVITSAISTIVCFIIIWYGAKVTRELYQTGYFTPTLLELPKFIIIGIIPLGSLLLVIQFVRRTYNYWKSWRASRESA